MYRPGAGLAGRAILVWLGHSGGYLSWLARLAARRPQARKNYTTQGSDPRPFFCISEKQLRSTASRPNTTRVGGEA